MSRWVSGALLLAGAVGLLACQGPQAEEVGDHPGMSEVEAAASCPRLPIDTDEQTVMAYNRVNMYRRALGLTCINFVPAIAAAAAAHCMYYVSNHGACIASPHREVSSCDKFGAERFSDRMKLGGYAGNPAYEVMTYIGEGTSAVDDWVDSVWHRIPILSPFVSDAGYGMVHRCDTMDFGWSSTAATTTPVVYPYDTQTGVPTSFDGDTESPALPRPPKGWPSGYPIIAFASGLKVQKHQLLDDKAAAVDHTLIAPDDAASNGLLLNEVVMYAHRPLDKHTAYRVVIEGTRESKPLRLEWTFTTR